MAIRIFLEFSLRRGPYSDGEKNPPKTSSPEVLQEFVRTTPWSFTGFFSSWCLKGKGDQRIWSSPWGWCEMTRRCYEFESPLWKNPLFMWPCFTTCRYISYILCIWAMVSHTTRKLGGGLKYDVLFSTLPGEMMHFHHSQQRMDPNLKNRWKRLKILLQKAPCKDIKNI